MAIGHTTKDKERHGVQKERKHAWNEAMSRQLRYYCCVHLHVLRDMNSSENENTEST